MQLFSQMPSLRRAWICACLAAALILVGLGCAHHGDVDALESELRAQEMAQEELAQQLARARDDLKVAHSDAAVLRSQLNKRHQVSLTQEQADVLYRAEAIKFNMLLTSGQNRDGEAGDEGLSVMLIPVDVHGDLVKLAGEVELDLFDMTLESEQQRLGQWKFTIDEVRAHWHSGFISTGYLFQIDWQKLPRARELTLHARLGIPDGRNFDVTTQVKVEPPSSSRPVARTAAPPRREGPSTALPGKASVSDVAPAAATVNARRPDFAKTAGGSKPPPPVRIHPARADDPAPTRTSDKWTDETIPTVR
jgi:hypothetical protein